MRESRAIMADLAATGLTPEQAALIMELSAAVATEARPIEDTAAKRRRERDRAYQAEKRRQNRQMSADSDDVKEIPPDPHKKYIPPVEASASPAPKGRERGHKIPEDWEAPPIPELSPEARSLASQWPDSAYRAEAEAFKNFWLAETRATSRKSDWRRAWCNRIVAVHSRVMRDAKHSGAVPVRTKPPPPMTSEELIRAIRFNEDQGNFDKAQVYRTQLQAIRSLGRPDHRRGRA